MLGIQAWFVLHCTFIVIRTKSMMGCWSKFGPYLAWVLTYVGLVFVPLGNIGFFAYHWAYG